MKNCFHVILSLLSASLLWGNAIAQPPEPQRVSIEVTGVSLQKPSGFEIADSFHGFQQESTGSSVVITLIPGPYGDVTQGMTQDTLATRGIELLSKQEITIAGQPGLLLHLSQEAYGQTYIKWLAVFGDATETRLVTASFPEEQTERLSESLRTVVLSPLLTEISNEDPSLPFGIGTVDGLTRVEELAGLGKAVAFSKTGVFPSPALSEPFFIVSPSLGDMPILDPRSYAIKRLHQTPHTEEISIQTISDIRIDGLTGFEIVATGRDQQSNQDLTLYLVMLYPSEGGYIIMQGFVGQENCQPYLGKFQSLAQTYRAIAD